VTTLTRKPNLIFLTIGGFLAFFLVKLIWWWIGGPTTTNPSPEKTPTKETVSATTSELGRLWQTFDWNSVTPGKALAEYVGPAWVNWIIWPLIGLMVFLVVRTIYRTFFVKAAAGAKPAESNTTWILFLMVMLLVAGLSSLVTEKVTVGSTVPATVTVDFIPAKDGTLVKKTGGYTTTYYIRMPAEPREWANQGLGWSVCPRIVRPTPAHVETGFSWTVHGYQFQMKIDQATIDRLMKKDPALLTQSADMTFELIGEVPVGTKDGCAFLRERQKRALADLLR